ncbi:MAG TPA: peptidoglycan-binding protein [Candidatus Omnitrophota bacterium]|nr:peptidoglycan-binding protein [Candidatus Omnitrophota bacterium]HPS36773.1 peptidoglycan-binding protein [Candidatus Omnitrophota bacterium]
MKNRFLCVFLFVVFTATAVFPPRVAEAASLSLAAPSVVLLDGGTVVYAKFPHAKRAPASTTKLVTVMVALDHLPLDRIVTIPPGLEYIQPSKIGLYGGERFYVRDLVKAALVKSANDAAEALAILTAGSRPAFARLMNQKAQSVGAYNSRFVNPAGLPAEGQYSTAFDLARIIMAASRYPYLVQAMKVREAAISTLDGRRIYLRNCNKMLWRTSSVIGKTGWTRTAKHCFAGRVQAGNRVIYVGIMGSARRQYLWSDLVRISAFASGGTFTPVKIEGGGLPSRKDTRNIQKALQRAGYFKGNPTGFFGKRTKSAVRNFQKANDLPVTGTVGPRTWKKLKKFM